MAKRAETRYMLWCDAGSPPASACRMPGEPEDNRALFHPFRNVIQRFFNDSRFHHQMTGAREAVGQVPWTIEDMHMASGIHARSQAFGFAGRKNWWLNEVRMDRSTRQER
eukprot:6579408-Pyramimonas_sp.AAC.1